GAVEPLDVEVGGGERPVAPRRPGGDLQGLVAVARRPGRNVGQGALGQARGEEAELHDATSVQVCERADASTASAMRAARTPSATSGSPSGTGPPAIAA